MKSKFHRILRLNIVYLLSLYQFIRGTEPLVECVLDLCIDFGRNLILNLLVNKEPLVDSYVFPWKTSIVQYYSYRYENVVG